MNAAEALTNAAIGFIVSWLATLFVLGYSPGHSLLVTAMFFVLSFARAYILRIAFSRFIGLAARGQARELQGVEAERD